MSGLYLEFIRNKILIELVLDDILRISSRSSFSKRHINNFLSVFYSDSEPSENILS